MAAIPNPHISDLHCGSSATAVLGTGDQSPLLPSLRQAPCRRFALIVGTVHGQSLPSGIAACNGGGVQDPPLAFVRWAVGCLHAKNVSPVSSAGSPIIAQCRSTAEEEA